MRLFGHNVTKYSYSGEQSYYKWKNIKLPKKIGEFLWNKQTPLWLHKCNFDGYIKNQCSICGRYKDDIRL